MIGTVHHKLHTLGNGTELADNQFVANKIVEVSDVLLKLVSTIHIVIVGIIADDDTWILHHILDEAKSWEVRIRENLVWIWSVHFTILIKSKGKGSQKSYIFRTFAAIIRIV